MVLQLTHSGRYSKPDGKAAPIIAHHSEVLDPRHNLPADYPLITDDELERLVDRFVEAAKLAHRAGFDGIDIKSCHRYLIAELHASFTRENSKFGGSFENRTRFVRTVAERILAEVPDLLVGLRMNAYDAIPNPYGFGVDKDDFMKPDLAEPKALIKKLREIGISVANITIANPYYNPHVNRPFDEPIEGGYLPDEHPLEGVARILGIAAEIQRDNPGFPIVSSGYSWLRQFAPNFAASMVAGGGATFAGFGRTAFAMPHFAKALIENGQWEPTETCIACSSCTQIMRDGGRSGCVVRDGEVYGPIYLEGRMKDPSVVRKLAEDCRECVAPTCVRGCPAQVDIPGFVRAIADGDDRKAYRILRRTNALPEICSRVCPAEVQCEGYCIQRHLKGAAVPIRLLQKYVSEKARAEGWAAVETPPVKTGKHVAVFGAGPAGLACAVGLLERGHEVTIFDPSGVAAGTAGATIPAERLPEDTAVEEIGALLGDVPADRLHWETGTALGKDSPLADMMGEGFDAAFLAMGLSESTALPGATKPKSGVVDALSFLKAAKRGEITDLPMSVAVLGGGNTAVDAAVTAKRLGARDVYVVYRRSFAEMPAWPIERDEALKLAVHFLILTQPLDYVADDRGRLAALKVARTRLGEPDDSGRRRPEVIEGSEWSLEVGLAVEAIGQRTSAELVAALGDIEMTRGGLIVTQLGGAATSAAGVFAGGDIVNGGTTAARAVHEGYSAAAEIDAYLSEAAINRK
jgi:NADPH-dependent glutamate synthase beta subunit-like oxidoreductase/2,4-dienoyl-CoA reductase-like NADH-dependent reductase (Old Yellow Enzyme family)